MTLALGVCVCVAMTVIAFGPFGLCALPPLACFWLWRHHRK